MTSTRIGILQPWTRAGFGDPLALGGALSALGALGVVITSAFYVASPPAVAGPVQPLDLAAAMAGALNGAVTLHAAGTIGVFGDLIWADGSPADRPGTGPPGPRRLGGRLESRSSCRS